MPSLPRGNYKRTRKHRILVYLCALIKKVVLMLTYIIIEIESYINSKITRNPIIYIVKNILASYSTWYDLKNKCWNNSQKYYLRFDHICFLFVYCNVCDWCICDIYIYLFRSRHFWHQLFCECLSCSSYSLWM